ncbi:MAG: serine protease [Luteolibacter sp.]
MKFVPFALAALLAVPLASAATGPLKDKALALQTSYKESVVFISAVVELEVTAGDNPSRKEEKKVEVVGTVIGKDGLIVGPLSALDVASAVDGRTVNTPKGPVLLSAKSNTKEVKIIRADGSEVSAKVAFKDTDLDLAFIRPEKPEEAKLTPVNTEDSAKLGLMDDVIVLGRMGKDFNREPLVMTSEVISILTKPRTFGRIGAPSLGMPVFNGDGKFIGIGINRFPPKSDESGSTQATNVILPAADLLESASQAK